VEIFTGSKACSRQANESSPDGRSGGGGRPGPIGHRLAIVGVVVLTGGGSTLMNVLIYNSDLGK